MGQSSSRVHSQPSSSSRRTSQKRPQPEASTSTSPSSSSSASHPPPQDAEFGVQNAGTPIDDITMMSPGDSKRTSFRRSMMNLVRPREKMEGVRDGKRRSWRSSRRWSKAPVVQAVVEEKDDKGKSPQHSAQPDDVPLDAVDLEDVDVDIGSSDGGRERPSTPYPSSITSATAAPPSPAALHQPRPPGRAQTVTSWLEEQLQQSQSEASSPSDDVHNDSEAPARDVVSQLLSQSPVIVESPPPPPQPPALVHADTSATATSTATSGTASTAISTGSSATTTTTTSTTSTSPSMTTPAQPLRPFPPPGTLVVVQGIVHTTDVTRGNDTSSSTNNTTSNRSGRGTTTSNRNDNVNRRRRARRREEGSSSSASPDTSATSGEGSTSEEGSGDVTGDTTPDELESSPLSPRSQSSGRRRRRGTNRDRGATDASRRDRDRQRQQRAPAISPGSVDVLGTLLSVAAAATAASLLTGSSPEPLLNSASSTSTATSPTSPAPAPTSPSISTVSPTSPSSTSDANNNINDAASIANTTTTNTSATADPTTDTYLASRAERMRQAWSTIRERLGLRPQLDGLPTSSSTTAPSAAPPGILLNGNAATSNTNTNSNSYSNTNAITRNGNTNRSTRRSESGPNPNQVTDTRELMLAEMARAFNIGLGLGANGVGLPVGSQSAVGSAGSPVTIPYSPTGSSTNTNAGTTSRTTNMNTNRMSGTGNGNGTTGFDAHVPFGGVVSSAMGSSAGASTNGANGNGNATTTTTTITATATTGGGDANGGNMPPEGSFDRFLVDLQADLRVALTPGDAPDVEDNVNGEGSESGEGDEETETVRDGEETDADADTDMEMPSLQDVSDSEEEDSESEEGVGRGHGEGEGEGEEDGFERLMQLMEEQEREAERRAALAEEHTRTTTMISGGGNPPVHPVEELTPPPSPRRNRHLGIPPLPRLVIAPGVNGSGEGEGVPEGGGTASPNGRIDANGRINWWRLYRFPAIHAPGAVGGLGVNAGTGAAGESLTVANGTATATATALTPTTNATTTAASTTTQTQTQTGPAPILPSFLPPPPGQTVVPVIVVGLQSVNPGWGQDGEEVAGPGGAPSVGAVGAGNRNSWNGNANGNRNSWNANANANANRESTTPRGSPPRSSPSISNRSLTGGASVNGNGNGGRRSRFSAYSDETWSPEELENDAFGWPPMNWGEDDEVGEVFENQNRNSYELGGRNRNSTTNAARATNTTTNTSSNTAPATATTNAATNANRTPNRNRTSNRNSMTATHAAAAAAVAASGAPTGPGSRTFLIYVVGGYYPPDHTIVTGGLGDFESFEALLELAEMLGQAKPPTVSKEEIAKSGLEIIKPWQLTQYEDEGRVSYNCIERCLICLDDYDHEDDIRIMGCRHAFHRECVDKWLQTGRNNCPACRSTGVNTESRTTASASAAAA